MSEYTDHDDHDEPRDHEEWVPLGHGIWLILHTFPDGSAVATWAVQQPGGGFRVHL